MRRVYFILSVLATFLLAATASCAAAGDPTAIRINVPEGSRGTDLVLVLSDVQFPAGASGMRVFFNPPADSTYSTDESSYVTSVSKTIDPGAGASSYLLPVPAGVKNAVRVVLVPISLEGKIVPRPVTVKSAAIRDAAAMIHK